MTTLTLALDWTPNINHIGFFIAQEKGFYTDLGLDVQIVDPSMDNYGHTPAKKVELGMADFALCPTESIISYQTKSKPFDLVAIAAILQNDLSAIVVQKDQGIQSPKDLDGKRYASYQARYEDQIVKRMIINDGGKGNLHIDYPAKLGIWNTVLQGNFDATWIFMNWEGVEAENLDADLSYFTMKDYGIPYSYSPVIAANGAHIKSKREAYGQFLHATKQGYLYSKDHPQDSIELFRPFVPATDAKIDLHKALEATHAYFGDEADWGRMNTSVISEFINWIYDNGLETQRLEVNDLMTQLIV